MNWRMHTSRIREAKNKIFNQTNVPNRALKGMPSGLRTPFHPLLFAWFLVMLKTIQTNPPTEPNIYFKNAFRICSRLKGLLNKVYRIGASIIISIENGICPFTRTDGRGYSYSLGMRWPIRSTGETRQVTSFRFAGTIHLSRELVQTPHRTEFHFNIPLQWLLNVVPFAKLTPLWDKIFLLWSHLHGCKLPERDVFAKRGISINVAFQQ